MGGVVDGGWDDELPREATKKPHVSAVSSRLRQQRTSSARLCEIFTTWAKEHLPFFSCRRNVMSIFKTTVVPRDSVTHAVGSRHSHINAKPQPQSLPAASLPT
jgi:hypothetical protein